MNEQQRRSPRNQCHAVTCLPRQAYRCPARAPCLTVRHKAQHDALNAITGGAAEASLVRAWESGRRRTGKRNRAGLCALYRERSEALFAHQDGSAASVLEASGTDVVAPREASR